jgi:hypothetical protein
MIKTRRFPESNYSAVWFAGKTIRSQIDPTKPITELKFPEFYDVDIFETMNGLCRANCPWCFLPGEPVKTIDGDINIEDIKLDTSVFSYDEKNSKVCTKPVEQLFSRKYSGNIYIIELENNKIIKCTENHQFFTLNRGWVEAKDLNEKDEFFDI